MQDRESKRRLARVCFNLGFLCKVVLLPLGALGAPISAAAQQADEIHNFLEPLVDDGTIAGAIVLVADRDSTLYLKPVGYRDLAAKAPMPANALFWIASTSKPMTASAFMMLVDEGKVSLDDPVEKYLPEFKGQKVWAKRPAEDDGNKPPTNPEDLIAADRPIKVREILSHTSGLPGRSSAEMGVLDLRPLRDGVRIDAAEPLLFQPGTQFRYSNEGINTVGRIIEVVSGMPYEEFMQKRLFGPLGMKDTTFWPNREQIGRLATSYKVDGQTGKLKPVHVDQLTYPLDDRKHRFPMPAGGIFSTASDAQKFAEMILHGGVTANGKRLLSESAVHQMTSKQTGSLEESYGFGFFVEDGKAGHPGAYRNEMQIDFTTGRILIFVVQQAGEWGTKKGDEMVPALEKMAKELPAKSAGH